MPVSAIQLAIRQFRALEPAIRLVLLHPNFFHHHTLLAEFLQGDGTVYVRLEGAQLTREQVETQIQAAVEHQTGTPSLDGASLLVIDECDRVNPAEFNHALTTLVLETARGRVILLSRHVPSIVLEDERLKRVTVFIPADESMMLWDYARAQSNGNSLLEVRSLGSGRVHLNGKPVDSWDGLLPRSLFFYLVDRGMTTRGEIFETFWPALSTREATNVFHVTKRKISEVLGMDLTVYWSGFYRIAPHIELSYDSAVFNELVQSSAVVSNHEAIDLLRRAISLYRGDFLTSVNMSWAERRRQELVQTYGDALVQLAKAIEGQGAKEEALGYYLRAVKTSPQREDLTMSIMRLYRDLGKPADSLKAYERLEQELKTSLGVAPARHVQELADTIRGSTDVRH